MKHIYSIVHGIGGIGIGSYLINELSEAGDIISHRGQLLDREQLSNEQLMLVVNKTIM